MSEVIITKNEYGTPVANMKCKTCGNEFTVCPVPKEEKIKGWDNCLSVDCASYDPSRDADVLFMSDKELSSHNKVMDMGMLRQRKDFKAGKPFSELLDKD